MNKLYAVSVTWTKTPIVPTQIDAVLGNLGDWIRINGMTWLVWGEATPEKLAQAARTIASSSEDVVFVIRCDPSDVSGWAPPWVWDWARSKSTSSLSQLGSSYKLPPRR